MANELGTPVARRHNGGDDARSRRQSRQRALGIGFQAVEPAGIGIEERKEHQSQNRESGELPNSRTQRSKHAQAKNRGDDGEARDKQANPPAGRRWAKILRQESDSEKGDPIELEREEEVAGQRLLPAKG